MGLRVAQGAVETSIAAIEMIEILITARRTCSTEIAVRITALLVANMTTSVTWTGIISLRHEVLPTGGRTEDQRIAIGITGRLIRVRRQTAFLVHRGETATMTVCRLVHRADLPIVVRNADDLAPICEAVEVPALAMNGRTALLAPIETTAGPNVDHLARREAMLTEGPTVDLRTSIVAMSAEVARQGRKLIEDEHATQTVVRPRRIDAMMTEADGDDRRESVAIFGPMPDAVVAARLQRPRGVLTRFSRLDQFLERMTRLDEKLRVVGRFDFFAHEFDVEETIEARAE